MRLLRRIRSYFPSLERLLRKLSLRAQVAILLAVAMTPVGIFAITQGMSTYSETKKLRREAFALGAVQASRDEQAAILEAFGKLSALNSQLDIDAPVSECIQILSDFKAQEPTVPFIGYIRETGVLECASPPPATPLDFSDDRDFKVFRESPRRAVTAQVQGQVSGQQVIIVSQPIYRDGKFRGGLSMSISSRYLEWVARSFDRASESRFAFVTNDGRGIAQSERGQDFQWLPSESKLRDILSDPQRVQEDESRAGNTRLYAITPLFEEDIFAVASWPGDSIPSALDWRDYLTISLPILMWGLAVSVAYFAVDQLALRHILYLDRLVTAYGRSGRALRAQRMRDAPTEIAKLGASFDEMAEEIETRENALLETVSEKDALLREVNHRVKNNLQLVSSLMSLQIREAEVPRERIGLERLQERIQGLALVHQKIYESENTNAVRLDLIIAEIASNLNDGSARTMSSVKMTTDLDEVTASPDTSVPLVLFATEAIVNTFKHSLSHVEDGWLDIKLKDSPDTLSLTIENSVHLFPERAENEGRRGIGQQLSDGFARQLHGKVNRTRTDDAFKVELKIPHAKTA